MHAIAGTASGTIINTATATVPAGTTDPNPGNNAAANAVSVGAAPIPPATPVPTLNEWALAVLSMLLMVLGALAYPRVKHIRMRSTRDRA